MTAPKKPWPRKPETKPKKANGRPRKIAPNDEVKISQIEAMAGYGLTNDQIAAMIGVSTGTLERNFLRHIHAGRAKGVLAVAQNLYKRAVQGDNIASMFYLRSRAGWSDRSTIEHVGKDGGPIAVTGTGLSGLLASARAMKVKPGGTD